MAVRRALDGEQLVHAPHGLERQGGDHRNLLLGPLPSRSLDVGQFKELAPGVDHPNTVAPMRFTATVPFAGAVRASPRRPRLAQHA